MRKQIDIACSCILLSFAMFSCIPDPLGVDGLPTVEPQIVVTSQMLPNGSLAIVLTKTFTALDTINNSAPQDVLDQLALNDALVTITGVRHVDTLKLLDHGVYFSEKLSLVPGEMYSLRVSSITMGTVTATATVMPAIYFDSVAIKLIEHGKSDWAQVTYTANDLPDENYYLLTVQQIRWGDLRKNISSENGFSHLVNDKGLDTHILHEQFNVVPGNFSKGDTVSVSISNISTAFYDFLTLRIGKNKSLVEYLSEPVNYPSNVIGGKGFFNLHVADIRVFTIEN
jgi:hypothetical protein